MLLSLGSAPSQAGITQTKAAKGRALTDPRQFETELERLVRLSEKATPACEDFEKKAVEARKEQKVREALALLARYPGKPAATQEIEARFLNGVPEGVDSARVLASFGRLEPCRFRSYFELAQWSLDHVGPGRKRNQLNQFVLRAAWNEIKSPGSMTSTVEVLKLMESVHADPKAISELVADAKTSSEELRRQLAAAENADRSNERHLAVAQTEIRMSESLRTRMRVLIKAAQAGRN